jgi:hypothetical protein
MGPWDVKQEGGARPFQATVDVQLQEYGQNDDTWGHPHDHDDAKLGNNQGHKTGTAEPYLQIPANIGSGFSVSPFGPSFGGG